MMAQWSGLFLLGPLFPGSLGRLLSQSVLGSRKVGDIQIFFFFFWAVDTFQYPFFVFKAFILALALGGAGASFFTFGDIFIKKKKNQLKMNCMYLFGLHWVIVAAWVFSSSGE